MRRNAGPGRGYVPAAWKQALCVLPGPASCLVAKMKDKSGGRAGGRLGRKWHESWLRVSSSIPLFLPRIRVKYRGIESWLRVSSSIPLYFTRMRGKIQISSSIGGKTMNELIENGGNGIAVLGVLICLVSGLARLGESWYVVGFQIMVLFTVGIGLMVLGCLAKLHLLTLTSK